MPTTGQGVFFDRCGIKSMLCSVLDGFASTCFAYGQTGSGKTYSLIGPENNTDKLDQRSSEHDGLLSRAVKFLFSEIKRRDGVELGCRFLAWRTGPSPLHTPAKPNSEAKLVIA